MGKSRKKKAPKLATPDPSFFKVIKQLNRVWYPGLEGKSSVYITIYSKENYEFIIKRICAFNSIGIRHCFSVGCKCTGELVCDCHENIIYFRNIDSDVMAAMCNYCVYKTTYSKTLNVGEEETKLKNSSLEGEEFESTVPDELSDKDVTQYKAEISQAIVEMKEEETEIHYHEPEAEIYELDSTEGAIPPFIVEPEIAFRMLMASNMLAL